MKALAVVLAVALVGCSFFMDKVPSKWRPDRGPPRCSDSAAAPSTDRAVAIGLTAFAVGLLLVNCSNASEGDIACFASYFYGGGALILAIPYEIAAYKGYRKRSKCNKARREYGAWQRDQAGADDRRESSPTGGRPYNVHK